MLHAQNRFRALIICAYDYELLARMFGYELLYVLTSLCNFCVCVRKCIYVDVRVYI